MNATPATRGKLSRDGIVQAALELADRDGIDALTIRALADALDTKPMSLYHHVKNKDGLLAAMVEEVFAQIQDPPVDMQWKDAVRTRCHSARQVLGQHPWAVPMLESGTVPGPRSLEHHEAVLAALTRGGLPLPLIAHAYAILESFIYGFVIEEANLTVQGGGQDMDVAAEIAQAFDPEKYPNLVRLTMDHVMQPGYAFASSFDFGLTLILNGLEAAIPAHE